jgi:SnoaL-like domain
MSHPLTLTSLTPREAITDAVYRAVISFDSNDVSLFNSAFIGEDVSMEVHGSDKRVVQGLSNIRTQVLAQVGPMDTSHIISNVRVDVKDGADTASLTCYALAQHCPPGRGMELNGPKYLGAGEYWADLLRDESDGLWKIKKLVIRVLWAQGDYSVMQRPS